MTRDIGTGPAGEAPGGDVDTVNGVPPVDGDVSLVASDIPSDGPSTVQADLDAAKYIESATDLEARFPAAGGVHTIDQGSEWRLPAGATTIDITPNQIAGVFPGGVAFVGGHGVIESNSSAALASGELAVANATFRNTGVGSGSLSVDFESLFGRELTLTTMGVEGLHPGRIANVAGIGVYTDIAVRPSAPGATSLGVDGTNGAALFKVFKSISPGTTPYTGLEFLATASIVSATIQPAFVQGAVAGDALVRIDNAATITSTISVFLSEAIPPATVFDGTGIDQSDPRVLALTNINAPSSRWLGDVIFDAGGGSPITLTMSGGVEVMPNENAGAVAVAAITTGPFGSERFTYDSTALQDWELISDSRNDDIQGDISWAATVKRNGGTIRDFTGWIQYRTGPDPAVWTTHDESKGRRSLNTTYDSVGGSAPFQWNRTYEFRLAVQGTVGTDTDIEDWRIQIGLGRP